MAVEDRNVHRNAVFSHQRTTVNIDDVSPVSTDLFRGGVRPRHNFRIEDVEASADQVNVSAVQIRGCIGLEGSAIGAPQFTTGGVATFGVQAFVQIDQGVFVDVAAITAQAFTAAATITAMTWGVFTVQVSGSQVVTTKAATSTMSFPSEDDAIRNAPSPDSGNGLVGVIAIRASAINFVAGTTNSNVASQFNTIDRGGHVATLAVLGTPQIVNAVRSERGTVAGLRNLTGIVGDFLLITQRSNGANSVSDVEAGVVWRKFPLQGEQGPDISTGRVTGFLPS